MSKALLVDFKDNVASVTSSRDEDFIEVLLPDGTVQSVIDLSERIPFGHKVAVVSLPRGVKVVKYGEVIGVTTRNVQTGEWVHTHNLVSGRVSKSQEGA